MKALIRKIFYDPAWSIGYRKLECNGILTSSEQAKYHTIKAKRTQWYADPFLFSNGDDLYLFAEIKKIWTGKAVLGVAKFDGVQFGAFTVCLEEPFHLSYPNVFKYKDAYFMLPETSHIHQLRLYRATKFPYSWELCCILKDGVDYADCSILEKEDGKLSLYCYDTGSCPPKTILYDFDPEAGTVNPSVLGSFVNERPGGNVLCVNGTFYRPLQDCKNSYGDHLIITRTNILHPYSETKVEEIFAKQVSVVGDNNSYCRIHTLNRAGDYEVVDLGFDKFYLSKILRKVYLKFIKKKRR